MPKSADLVSPKQAARAFGVSESSLKRWCDQGRIPFVRTAGGHRKMPIADVLDFVRRHDQALASPEILGLPAVSPRSHSGLTRGRPRLAEALLAGDELLARQVVLDLYLAQHSLSVICDEVIAGAFRDIGDRWACQQADVFQERRGCEIALRILFELRRLQPAQENKCRAIGGTIEGDAYCLPSAMAELVLRQSGFQATSLGTGIPFESLTRAVEAIRPRLFWLSVSHIREGLDFVSQFAALSATCASVGTALVVGGRALVEDLRRKMTYAAYCDNMQHLESFAKVLLRSKSTGGKASNRRRRLAPRGKMKPPGTC